MPTARHRRWYPFGLRTVCVLVAIFVAFVPSWAIVIAGLVGVEFGLVLTAAMLGRLPKALS